MKKSLMVLKFTLKNSSQSPYAKRIEYILEGNLENLLVSIFSVPFSLLYIYNGKSSFVK